MWPTPSPLSNEQCAVQIEKFAAMTVQLRSPSVVLLLGRRCCIRIWKDTIFGATGASLGEEE